MMFTAPLALWGLLAVPLIVVIHLFRQPLRRRRVAGLFLFADVAPVPPTGRVRDRLRATRSLLLECLAAALIALWLAGPVLGVGDLGRHVIVVLDDTASMTAPGAGVRGEDGTARDQAAAYLTELVDELGSSGRLTVYLAGERPALLLGPRAPAAGLDLSAWEPARPEADFAAAILLAEDLAATEDQLVFVTDRSIELPERWEVRAFGAAVPNVALADARVLSSGGEAQVHVVVSAYGGAPRNVEVRLTGGGATTSQIVEVRPGRPVVCSLPWQGGAVARLEIVDGVLSLDDSADLVLPLAGPVRVGWDVGPALAAELRLEDLLGAVGVDAERVDENADLWLTTGNDEATATCVLDVRVPDEVVARTGPFLTQRADPLLTGVDLAGVVWSAGSEGVPTLPGRALIQRSDRPLLTRAERGDRLWIHLEIDPARSNLTAAPDWPALFVNLLDEARRRRPGTIRQNVRLGEEVRWRGAAGDDASALRLLDPSGEELVGAGWEGQVWAPRVVGLHRLMAGGDEIGRFGIAFHAPLESDTTARSAFVREGAEMPPQSLEQRASASGRSERLLLALFLLVIVVADWFVLRRER